MNFKLINSYILQTITIRCTASFVQFHSPLFKSIWEGALFFDRYPTECYLWNLECAPSAHGAGWLCLVDLGYRMLPKRKLRSFKL